MVQLGARLAATVMIWALNTGSIVSLVVCATGALLTWQRRSYPTALDEQSSRTFGIVVGIEFALAGIGAGVLAATGHADVIAAWVAVVVGVHLFPLAALFNYPLLYVTAALVTVVGIAAVPIARSSSVEISAVAGAGSGAVLLATAVFSVGAAIKVSAS